MCPFLVKNMIKHNFSKTRFYRIYHVIRQRCEDANFSNYPSYGGRGVRKLWKSFEQFRDDMHESYLEHVREFGEKDTTIERIDVNGHYCKENCRWATNREQSRNKTNSRFLQLGDNKRNMSDWVGHLGLSQSALTSRINRLRWSVERTLTEKRREHPITYKGKTKKLSEWAREFSINKGTLHKRIRKGWPVKRAFTQEVSR